MTMMSLKNSILLFSLVVFFLLVNSSYYWEGKLGGMAFPATILLFLAYCLFVIIGIFQLYFAVQEKFKNNGRNISIFILSIVLIVTYVKPLGIIDFEKFEGEDILFADREGAANCNTVFKLKSNNKFVEKSHCFGVEEIRGDYIYRNDTIYFLNVKTSRGKGYYKFAVIKKTDAPNKEIIADLVRYLNIDDTIPHTLWITKNKLNK